MGGIRNREEKKKANHVVSSGAGGSSKGPSIIDKRGQEVKCPYCDKIYTQSGRLKDHIATKHKDEAEAAPASSSSSSAAGGSSSSTAPSRPTDRQTAQTHSSKHDPNKQQPSQQAQPAVAKAGAKGPAAAAAAAGSGASHAAGSAAASGGSGGGSSSVRASGGMMDIGSAAGYYTSKSPKMHLLEAIDQMAEMHALWPKSCSSCRVPCHSSAQWTQREGRLKPRITHRTDKDGNPSCKVVLPHAKKQEEDIVVFLDAQWSKDVAGDAGEMEQRAAVAALHRVAGDRNYHMLLPKQYVGLWKEMGQVAAERKDQAAQRMAVAAQRSQRDRERAAKALQRAFQPLVMSREKQALIQELIRRHAATRQAGAGAAAGPQAAEVQAHVMPSLLAMGFSAAQVHMAVEAVAGSMGEGCGPPQQEEQVLDWLLVHLAQEQLPSQMTAGAHLSRTVTKHVSGGPGLGAKEGAGVQAAAQQQVHLVSSLAEYGYPPAQCEMALAECGGDTHAALAHMYARLTGARNMVEGAAVISPAVIGDEGIDEAWAEEQLVLEAIYGDDLDPGAAGTQGHVAIRMPLPEGCGAAVVGAAGGAQLTLKAWCGPPGAGPGQYPARAPLLAVSCPALPPASLRALTRQLASHVHTLLGTPMLHELATHLTEAAEQLSVTTETDEETDSFLQQDFNDASEAALGDKMEEEEVEESGTDSCWDGDDSEEGDEADATDLASSVQGGASSVAFSTQGDPVEAAAGAGGEEREGAGEPEEELAREASGLVDQFEGMGLGDLGPDDAADGIEGEDEEESTPTQPVIAATTKSTQQQQPVFQPQMEGRRRQGARRLRPADVAAENERLLAHQQQLEQSPGHAQLRQSRSRLPAAGMRRQVLEALAKHAVLVISGATGCGKSTQVPQFILEDAVSRRQGAATNIIVTQPRRISALGLAQRVAQERGEEVGESVGYSVRLDSRMSARTRLLFCTTGILLRRLLSDPLLSDVSHVVLDEVHERSIEIDLLLLLLRDVLTQRAAQGGTNTTRLQVVLMSATADAALFAGYMQPRGPKPAPGPSPPPTAVGQLTIPGFTYPVREMYLEDIFERTGYVVGRSSKYAKKGGGKQASEAVGAGEDMGHGPYSPTTLSSLSLVDEELINYDALAALITHIVSQQQQHGPAACMDGWQEGLDSLNKLDSKQVSVGGAVLVFLPGAPEISRAARVLQQCTPLHAAAGGQHKLRILPLHGSLSAKDQTAVFARMPAGHTKIVLSTNVAETSITIDDVSFVVDSGRAKEMQHDTERGILRLQEQWVSQAAAMQRRGRAGRVRPGVCFRMFSRRQWAQAPTHTAPEMLRSPLESVVLLIKGMAAGHAERRHQQGASGLSGSAGPAGKPVASVLSQCLSPPDPAAVCGAVSLLQHIGALDGQEVLTPLGHHLKQMPLDPRVGKMLVYGCMLGCLDPVLTIAAAMAHGRPIFMSAPPDRQADVTAARRGLVAAGVAARSDHVALVAAYNEWARRGKGAGGRTQASALCTQCCLSESSLEAVAAGRSEYAGVLADLGFLPRPAAQLLGPARGRGAGVSGADLEAWSALPCNAGADNARFLKAAVMAGFYPSVIRVQHPPTQYMKLEGVGAVEKEADPKTLKFFDKTRGRVFVHPGSVNFRVGKYNSGWLVYTQMTATSKLFVRECSMAPVYSLLLFGGQVHVNHREGTVAVDDQATFSAPPHIGALVKELRGELNAVLARKIAEPGFEMTTDDTVSVVMQLLSTDGF